jgi:hypothetical protein
MSVILYIPNINESEGISGFDWTEGSPREKLARKATKYDPSDSAKHKKG